MSHFNACVLIKNDGSDSEKMEERANNMLAHFDINKEIAPYKYYVKVDDIERMAKHYGIDATNLTALAEKLEDWNSDKGGVDEKGFFGISTKNPEGHIDSWSIFAETKPENREQFLREQANEGNSVRVIVTPEGKWFEGPWIYGAPNPEQEKELREWEKKATEILNENKDAFLLLVDCHV